MEPFVKVPTFNKIFSPRPKSFLQWHIFRFKYRYGMQPFLKVQSHCDNMSQEGDVFWKWLFNHKQKSWTSNAKEYDGSSAKDYAKSSGWVDCNPWK